MARRCRLFWCRSKLITLLHLGFAVWCGLCVLLQHSEVPEPENTTTLAHFPKLTQHDVAATAARCWNFVQIMQQAIAGRKDSVLSCALFITDPANIHFQSKFGSSFSLYLIVCKFWIPLLHYFQRLTLAPFTVAYMFLLFCVFKRWKKRNLEKSISRDEGIHKKNKNKR